MAKRKTHRITVDMALGPHKKDTTRLIKVTCESCGYTVRTTRKWLDEGLPQCPDGEDMFEEQPKE